jgi:predicted MFS family arabinose efflux permease
MMNKKAKNLLVSGNLWYFGEGMLGPLFAVFSDRVGGDILDISIAWAVYLIVSGTFAIFVGYWADKSNNAAKIMVLGFFLNALFTFGYLFVNSQTGLLIVQAGLGIANALATPTWNSLYAKHQNPKRKGLVWGLADGGADIVTGIAILVGGFIVANYSFELLFLTMGLIQTLAAINQVKILRFKR